MTFALGQHVRVIARSCTQPEWCRDEWRCLEFTGRAPLYLRVDSLNFDPDGACWVRGKIGEEADGALRVAVWLEGPDGESLGYEAVSTLAIRPMEEMT